MTKKRAGIALVVIGAVLLIAALLLFIYNRVEDANAGNEAAEILTEIQTVIPDAEQTDESADNKTDKVMPTVNIDGYDYIGYLKMPALELELPVMADWDYTRLRRAPCRHFGTTYNDDLVIAAHNYKTHFGSLSNLAVGTEVFFTDMDGAENRYVLAKEPRTLNPEAVDAVQNSGYDLVLYTCTPGGASRVVAFFDRVTEG